MCEKFVINTELSKYQREAILQIYSEDRLVHKFANGIWQIPYLSSFAARLQHNALNYWTLLLLLFRPWYILKDQATKLENIGIPALTLSDISKVNMRVVERGAFSVVYGNPEAWLKIDRWRKC